LHSVGERRQLLIGVADDASFPSSVEEVQSYFSPSRIDPADFDVADDVSVSNGSRTTNVGREALALSFRPRRDGNDRRQ
jgi:hypothetical protein